MIDVDGIEMLCPPEPDEHKLMVMLQRTAHELDGQHPEMANAVRQAMLVIRLDSDRIEHLKRALSVHEDGEEWD